MMLQLYSRRLYDTLDLGLNPRKRGGFQLGTVRELRVSSGTHLTPVMSSISMKDPNQSSQEILVEDPKARELGLTEF